jgi:mRNA interferase MazF
MKKGEIWLVNFDPSVGKEYQKIRPALVIKSEEIVSSLVTIMPLSSVLKQKKETDISLSKDSKNRLFSDSILRTEQISSFDTDRFIHFVGVVSPSVLLEVDQYLRKHFGL